MQKILAFGSIAFAMTLSSGLAFSADYSAPTQQPDTAPPVNDEIIVEGEALVEQLKGKLRDGFKAFEAGDYAEAEDFFSKVTKQFRNIQLRQFEDVHYLSSILGSGRRLIPDPTYEEQVYGAAIYYMLGLSQAFQGNTKSAKVSMRKAIKLNHRNLDARLDYALLELRSGNLEKAEKQIKKAKKLMKKCKDHSAGRCESLQGKLADAQFVLANTSVR